jgi:hypothetical protein
MYRATVIADSIAHGVRLTTLEVVFPRFILAEFNTHRVFSRNSASSRAIPVERRISQVWRDPFVPEAFGVNKRGMQASANLGGWKAWLARRLWLLASKICVCIAWCLSKIDVHKQHANRVIELWAWHTVVVSSVEWENFFNLRTDVHAQPEMQITAMTMLSAYAASTPRELLPGDWHLPYIGYGEDGIPLEDDLDLARVLVDIAGGDSCNSYEVDEKLIVISVVRCAAVSYERQHAGRPPEQYLKRHDEMRELAHWSPFEHQAQAADPLGRFTPNLAGNFKYPWMQYRKTFPGEAVWHAKEAA